MTQTTHMKIFVLFLNEAVRSIDKSVRCTYNWRETQILTEQTQCYWSMSILTDRVASCHSFSLVADSLLLSAPLWLLPAPCLSHLSLSSCPMLLFLCLPLLSFFLSQPIANRFSLCLCLECDWTKRRLLWPACFVLQISVTDGRLSDEWCISVWA